MFSPCSLDAREVVPAQPRGVPRVGRLSAPHHHGPAAGPAPPPAPARARARAPPEPGRAAARHRGEGQRNVPRLVLFVIMRHFL